MDWNEAALKLEGIAEDLGLNAMDYVPDDMPNAGIYIGEIDGEPNQSFNSTKPDGSRKGTDSATITLRLLVARSTDKHAIRKMRDWMKGSGDKSLIQAIQATNAQPQTYPWSGIKVVRFGSNRLFTIGEKRFYGTEITVYVTGAA